MYTVIDLHCDSVKFLTAGVDLRAPNPEGHIDLPRLRKGGVGVQVFAAFVSPSTPEDKAFSAACGMLDRIDDFAASDPALVPVETAEDCVRAIAEGKTGILKAVENGWAIEDSPDKLEKLRRRNVRMLTLVHSRHTHWAASCTGQGDFPGAGISPTGFPCGGLTPFGKKAVDAMNELGMIVDVSHAAESAFWDVLGRSKKPVIASHSCAYSICGTPRNLKDDQIKALAGSGGLVGVCFFPAFLNESYRGALDGECGDIFREIGPLEKKYAADPAGLLCEYTRMDSHLAVRLSRICVPVSAVADHIDYILRLAGEDCVGLGSDFDGVFSLPEGVGGCDVYPDLAAELAGRGYSDKRITKIFMDNFLRVMREHDK
jgi:membrane dipeptidase